MNTSRPRFFIFTQDGEEQEGVEFSDGTVSLQDYGNFASLASLLENGDATVRFVPPSDTLAATPRGRNFTLSHGDTTLHGRELPSGAVLLRGLPPGEKAVFTDMEALLREHGEGAHLSWQEPVTHRLLINAETLYDIVASLKEDRPFPVMLAGDIKIEIAAGDPDAQLTGIEHADLLNVELRGVGQ